jgi:UDPglucose--hexose-1-phosphate uridylyltransferase
MGGRVIEAAVGNLVEYGIAQGLVAPGDRAYVRNRVLEILRIEDYDLAAETADGDAPVDALLAPLLDDAAERGLIDPDTVTQRDLWDTAIMGAFVMHPSVIVERFRALHAQDPVAATEFFHDLSVASNYIRVGRTDRNVTWHQDTTYGQMDITINLSKPEKDPRDIAKAAKTVRTPSHVRYPANLLVRDNEGYPGRTDHPARQNLRLIPMELGGEPWLLQYSPYAYYPQHAIALSEVVKPMKMDGSAFRRLADFVELLPHYFIGSNADLPIVGGSILSHDHFQGGAYEFALDRAQVPAGWDLDGLTVEVLHWPLTVLRLRGARAEVLARATELLEAWRGYSDESRGVRAFSGDTPHNTITPIARRIGSELQLTLALRNNRTTPEHPDGIYHPHAEIHPIKRENIGLIEVMGLAVLPARLATELNEIALALATGSELSEDLSPHQPMLDSLRARETGELSLDEAVQVVRREAGDFFVRGLEHCGVFGDDVVAGTTRFLATLGWIGA